MKVKSILAALVAAAVAVALYVGQGLMADAGDLSERDLQGHLTRVMSKQAGIPVDQVGGISIDQIRAFKTALRPHHSPAFDGYEIVLSGLGATTCNQIMKSPWVESAVLAKSLTTQCNDPHAEIHLIMAAR